MTANIDKDQDELAAIDAMYAAGDLGVKLGRNEPQQDAGRLKRHAAFMTYEDRDGVRAYYLAPVNRTPSPYREQRQVTAIIDVASDGTFAGVELVMGDLPPAPKGITSKDQTP